MVIKCFKYCSAPVKILLFKTFCCNMYCSQLWSNFSKASFSKLKISFNRIFRILMSLDYKSSVSHAMLETDVNTFDFIVRNYIYKFKKRLIECNNLVTSTLLNSIQFYTSSIFKHWQQKLFI
jgi:hypothetical protein